MQIGYDYLLLRSGLQRRFLRASGMFLVVAGAIILAGGLAYLTWAEGLRSL